MNTTYRLPVITGKTSLDVASVILKATFFKSEIPTAMSSSIPISSPKQGQRSLVTNILSEESHFVLHLPAGICSNGLVNEFLKAANPFSIRFPESEGFHQWNKNHLNRLQLSTYPLREGKRNAFAGTLERSFNPFMAQSIMQISFPWQDWHLISRNNRDGWTEGHWPKRMLVLYLNTLTNKT